MRMSFEAAKAECLALGDEAHYENKGRFINTEAAVIIDSFDNVKQRCALRLAFFDGYDAAKDRQMVFDMLGVPMELRS